MQAALRKFLDVAVMSFVGIVIWGLVCRTLQRFGLRADLVATIWGIGGVVIVFLLLLQVVRGKYKYDPILGAKSGAMADKANHEDLQVSRDEAILPGDNQQGYVSVDTLASNLGIPAESIYMVLRSRRTEITQAEAEYVVNFHRALMAEADAARARIKARCEARGITPGEELRECFEYLRLHYPDKSLTEALAEIERKEALKRFSSAAIESIAGTLRPPEPSHGAPVEPFELAMQIARVYAEEFGRLNVFTPEELEQTGLELGWIIFDEFHGPVSEEMAELVLVHVRSECKVRVEGLLAEQE